VLRRRRAGWEIERDHEGRLIRSARLEGMTRGSTVLTTVMLILDFKVHNLVKLKFTATRPNQLLMTAITFVPM